MHELHQGEPHLVELVEPPDRSLERVRPFERRKNAEHSLGARLSGLGRGSDEDRAALRRRARQPFEAVERVFPGFRGIRAAVSAFDPGPVPEHVTAPVRGVGADGGHHRVHAPVEVAGDLLVADPRHVGAVEAGGMGVEVDPERFFALPDWDDLFRKGGCRRG